MNTEQSLPLAPGAPGAPLAPQAIRELLATRVIGQQIHYRGTVGSTNDLAKQLAQTGAPEGTLVIADEQTAGKGRLGRRWLAPANSCILMSLIFRPTLAATQAARLTMLCSLAAANAIEMETGLEVGVKWPNDLVVANGGHFRKLAGVLTETALTGDKLLYAIVGIGINVNLDPAVLGTVMMPATSLQIELGRPVPRDKLVAAILNQIDVRYPDQVNDGQIHTAWVKKLVTLNRPVVVTSGDQQLKGIAQGVDPDGALLLRRPDGQLERISVGDVSLRRPGP